MRMRVSAHSADIASNNMVRRIAIHLLQLLGFDPAAALRLQGRDLRYLAWSGAAVLLGAMVSACGGAYLVYLGVNAGGWSLVVAAAAAFVVVFLFAVNMRRMFITAGGCSHAGTARETLAWRPDNLRLVCVLFLAVLFAQPLLLLLESSQLERGVEEKAQLASSLYRRSQLLVLDQQRDQLLQRGAVVDEQLQLLGVAPQINNRATPINGAPGAPSRRKALLIGMQAYRHLKPLPSQEAQQEALKATLVSMGFGVTALNDAKKEEVLLAVDRYLKSLRAGDISLVYLRGYVDEHASQPRLLTVDAAPGKAPAALGLSHMMDDVAATSAHASIVLVDNAGAPLAPALHRNIPPPPNTALVIAYPSLSATKTGRNEHAFVAALTHHLGRGDAVLDVLRAVAGEVSASGREAPRLASTLAADYQQLSATAPAARLPLGGMVRQLNGSCPLQAETSLPVLKLCLLDLRNSLAEQQTENARGRLTSLDNKVLAYRDNMLRSGMVRERWKLAWTRPWLSSAIILACVLLMILGDVLRDMFPGALRRYEVERAILARQMVDKSFSESRDRVRLALQPYPAPPLPGPRWHELRSYFDMHVHSTPVRTPPFQSHGSKDELLDRLDWRTQETGDEA